VGGNLESREPGTALDRLNDELDGLNLEGHWRLEGAMNPEPKPWASARLWQWRDIRRVLLKAGEITEIEGNASRRTVRLCTPGLREKWATQTIHASFQLVKPGEVAEAHRHSMGALRFVVEGGGAYTNVDGEKFYMAEGDLILTPGWTWHDHGNESSGPIIWLDGHDAPLTGRLNAMFYERYPAPQQVVSHDDNFSRRRHGAMRPIKLVASKYGSSCSYKGVEARRLLNEMTSDDWDPHEGFALDYVNPVNGGPTLPSICCRLQRLPPGTETVGQRHTSSRIYQVVSGSGETRAGPEILKWEKGDAFVIPGWTWYEHANRASDDAVLFCMNDEPVLSALSLLRSEYRDVNTKSG
jgi:gentisate 1,2-dioxygenase